MRFDEVIRGVFDAVDSAAEEQNERNRRSDEELPVFPDVVYRRRRSSGCGRTEHTPTKDKNNAE